MAAASGCVFCDVASSTRATILFETAHCFFAASESSGGVLPGAGIICPRAHRTSPFELTDIEWADTHVLLKQAKEAIDQRLRPDGYNVIWNVKPVGGQVIEHAHLHLVPRFHDEPYAGRGARWMLKQPTNRRPFPEAPGRGGAG